MIANIQPKGYLFFALSLLYCWSGMAADSETGTETLHRSARFIEKLTDFHLDIQAQEFTKTAGLDEITSVPTIGRAWFKRPRMMLWVSQGPTWGSVAYCNGTSVTTYRPAMQAYTVRALGPQADAHTGIVEASYDTWTAALFAPDPWDAMPVGEIGDLGTEDVGTSACRHVTITGQSAAWDVWIAEGAKPVPLKMLMRTSSTRRQTTTTMGLTWDTESSFNPIMFEFPPPAGSHHIEKFPEPESETTEPLPIGSPAPELKLPMRGGGIFDLAAYKGKKVVVLDFWATWCHGCQSAMASMGEIETEFKPRGVELIAVNVKETTPTVESFLTQHKINLNVAYDTDAAGVTAYKIRRIPQTWIVGRDGLIKEIHVGYAPELKTTVTLDLATLADPAPGK